MVSDFILTKLILYSPNFYLLQRFERVFCFAKPYKNVVSLLYTLLMTWFLDPKFVLGQRVWLGNERFEFDAYSRHYL